MVAESLACPACHESVPPGRLSCPHCGTVLAAVGRAFRAGGTTSSETVTAASWASALEPTRSTLVEEAHDLPDAAGDEPPTPVSAYLAALGASPPGAVPDASPVAAPPPAGAWVPPAPQEVDDLHTEAPARAPAVPAPVQPVAPAAPAPVPAPVQLAAHGKRPIPDVLRPVEYAQGAALATLAPDPADPPARILPRTWDPAGAAAARESVAATAAAPRPRRLGLPVVDRERIDEAAGVVVLAGAMGAAVAFLLPWSRAVIGARNSGGYFDTWGLASSSHLIVFALVLGALALAALPNRVDTWLRTGVIGIALGSLLLGLAWPYAFGPLGAGLGVVVLVVAAVVLLIGGLVSTLVQRHAEPPPAV